MFIRALIADDERLMREQLRARLAEVWPELEIVAEAKNGLEAVQLTEAQHPDLVFLDIRMPGMTGIEAAREIAQLPTDDDTPDGWRGCELVFITAYDQYAIEAFEQGVVDYVLKPAERERLALTVQRVRARLAQRLESRPPNDDRDEPATLSASSASSASSAAEAASAAVADTSPTPAAPGLQQLLQKLAVQLNPAAAPRLRWIQATVGQTIQMIAVEDVLFFVSDEKYTRVQTASVEALIRKPIKELVEQLDAELFWQIHRSTLVNARAIAAVTRDLRGRQLVSVKGRTDKLEVSRSFAGLFKGM